MIFVAAAGIVVTTTVVVSLAVAAQAKMLFDSRHASEEAHAAAAAGATPETAPSAEGEARGEDVTAPLLGSKAVVEPTAEAVTAEAVSLYQAH